MEFPSLSIATILFLAALNSANCKETAQNSLHSHIASPAGDSVHHQTQKRSALIRPDDAAALEANSGLVSDPGAIYLDSPYSSDVSDLDKRSSLFRFGKRGGSLFRFGKRGSLFRFGKRDGTLFRFGRSGPQVNDGGSDNSMRDDKRTLFRFGKRSDLAELLARLSQYERMASLYDLSDDVDVKRGVDSFHWGRETDK